MRARRLSKDGMEGEGLSMSSFLSFQNPSFWSKVYSVRSWLLFIGLWLTIVYLIQQQLSMQQHAEDLIVNLRQEIYSIRKETSEALIQVLEQQQQQQQQQQKQQQQPPNSPSPLLSASSHDTFSSTNDPNQKFDQWPLLPSTSSQPKLSIILTAFAVHHRNFRPLINQVEAICSSTSKDILQTLELLIVFPKGSLDAKRQEVHQLLQTTLTTSSSPSASSSSTLPLLRLVSPSTSSPFSSPSSLGWTYAQANNAGAALARGSQLIFLGERVIPASSSWLSSLLKAKLEAGQREKASSTSPKLGLVTGRVLQYSPSSSSASSSLSPLENLEVRSAGIDFQFHTASSFLPPPSSILNELRAFGKSSSSSLALKRGASTTIKNIEGYTPRSFNVPLAFFRLRGVISNNSRATNKYSSSSKTIDEPIVVSATSQSVFLIERSLFLEVNGLETSLDDEVVSRNPHRYLEAEDNLALLDFCLRLHAIGYSTFYEADSIVIQKSFLPSPTSPVSLPSSKNTPSLPSVGHWSSSLLLGAPPDELNGVTSLAAARARFVKKWYTSLETLILSRRALGKTGGWGIQGIMYDMYGGCTGWNIETVNLVTPLEQLVPMNLVANQQTFCHGFPTHIEEALQRMYSKELSTVAFGVAKSSTDDIVRGETEDEGGDTGDNELLEMYEDDLDIEKFFSTIGQLEASKSSRDVIDIWISHKPPDAYPTFPYEGLRVYRPRPKYVIGRSMAETTKIPEDWVKKCNENVDELWVPSAFLFETFSRSGVAKEKIFKIGEPLDVALYDPEVTTPFALPMPFHPQFRKPALEKEERARSEEKPKEKLSEENQERDRAEAALEDFQQPPSSEKKLMRAGQVFKFLSVFKMETRKGWDILLEAYWKEFSWNETVALYLNTYLYADFQPRNVERIHSKFRALARKLNLPDNLEHLPPVFVLTAELPISEMPRLYKAADAFVLPSRGEGWGMPMMEAMGMGLPVIATNWSGPTEFMNEKNSYPLEVEAMVPIGDPNWSKAELWGEWAKPSVVHLRKLMRRVFTYSAEAKEKGRQARDDIRTRFSHEAISQQILDRLSVIQTNLFGKDPAQVQHDSKPQTYQTQHLLSLQADRRIGRRTRQKIHANMNNRA